MSDNETIYNIPGGMLVNDILDTNKIENAFKKLIEFHSSFRTCFKFIDDKPVQMVLDNVDFKIEVYNSEEANLKNIIDSFPKNFDLENAPLLRVAVHFLDNKKTLILIDSHHIIVDGSSLNILINDFCKLYNNLELEKSNLEYIDYAVWENNFINSDSITDTENYWLNNFKNSEIPVINLPYDYTISATPSYSGDKISMKISNSIFENIEKIAKECNCSSYMVFLATFYVLLYKYTSQNNIIVGSPIANRFSSDLQNIIGMFVNNIALNGHIESKNTFGEFLENIKTIVLNAMKNQAYPYDLLVKKLDLGSNNLFDVMFTYQNTTKAKPKIGNNEFEIIEANTHTSKFNLSLEIVPSSCVINLEFRTDLFKKETVARMLNHYINLLNNVSGYMSTKISNICILSEDERNMILYDFNNTKMDYPVNKTIAELFEEQVERTPDNVAVVFEGQSLTYRELNEKATMLSRKLYYNGIKTGDVVGVCLNRSIELITCICSLFKLGAIYMPMCTEYPADRLEYMLKNSNAKLVITNSYINREYNFNNIEIEILDSIKDINYSFNKNIVTTCSPNSIAYIIYTSGSTGKPKGVQISNSNLINFVYSFMTYFNGINSEDIFLSSTNISFDVSIFEIFVPLLNGACLVPYHNELIKDVIDYCDYIEKCNITALYIPPNILDDVYSILKDKNNVKINKLLVGVEAIKKSTLNKYFLLNPNMHIVNGYGPTETTICCTALLYQKSSENSTDIVSIGKPLHNNNIYILDDNMNIQPIGVYGELYISGAGVGSGYINNATETSKNYINNNFDSTSKKMYKTGDLAKWNSDGTIKLLGRLDDQVKLSGYRIELKEIDAIIMSYPKITKSLSVVINKKDLVSYYTATECVDEEDLLSFLNKKLPFYMIPKRIMQLENFPITSNGKIDKHLLPVPTLARTEKYIAPQTETQNLIVSIWTQLFKITDISIYDNFFNIGGDSLLLIKLVSNIYDKFNIKLAISDIFNNPTIKELSELIDSLSINDNKISIPAYGERNYYPISSAQKRIFVSSNVNPNSTLYNISGGILFDSVLDINKLQIAINTIIKRHTILSTYFEIVDGNIVQKIAKNLNIKLVKEKVDTTNINELFEKYKTIFNLNVAPLWNIYLLELPNNKSLFILNAHHIILDGTSLNNLIQEISDAYNQNTLPELSISYTDFAIWEEEQLQNNGFNDSKEYWQEQFKDDIPILNMPTTFSRPANKSYDGNTFITYISKDITKKISDFAFKHSVTPYMVMLCAYYILLYKYTSQEDIVVGSPISGRFQKELEPLLGMFVNSLPLRTTISSNLAFSEFLNNVKNLCMDAFSHQDYPFDVLVNDLNIPRDNSRNPLFDTMFIYQNNGFKELNFDGISGTYCVPNSKTAKFDISLEVLPENNDLKLSFEYCTKLFDEYFINKFSTHYLNILNNVLENSDIQIRDICMLSEAEQKQILNDFNNTKMDYPSDKTIADLFEEQVEKTPNNIAVVFEDKELTYKELNEKANQLAWYLSKSGINSNSIVGIMLPRSLEVIIAMLSILKLGACYIPIDPTLPDNRINYMLENSKANTVLTFKNVYNNINVPNKINIKLDNSEIYSCTFNNLNLKVNLDAPSYMIYTSGSTGTPKGVMLNYKALTNLATYLTNTVEFLKDEYSNIAIASITTISFDIFIFETLICLQRGLRIILANEAEQNTPNLLNKLILKNDVKAIQMTPSRMHIFITNKDIMPNLNNLKYVVLAGEALPKDLLDSILSIGNIKVYNGYGPSETTVFSSFTDVTNYNNITIGKPLGNTKFYVLDKDMNLCPIGIPGELYISGDGVGLKYINNEQITKERFISDIFYSDKIMYKTGDLVKYLPNGELCYISRIDNQIKIRGLRIELDEIENCILQFPNIDKCIITANTDNNNRQFIVAYLSVTDRISTNKLRNFLKSMLPKYMIPSYFVILDKIPYLNNGKINKKALPAPQFTTSTSEANYVAPKNKLELQIAGIFQDLLSIYPIGINDNFFELGGDSLLAINLQIELLKINNSITYSDIFMYPTVAELANKISAQMSSSFASIDTTGFDAFDEILLKTRIMPKNLSYKSLGNIMISGVTGYLGAHVLDTFLKEETGIAYCLIRTEPGLTLENKLLNKLHFYFGDKYDNLIGNRIIIVNSDIAQNDLGLSTDKLDTIADNVSCVINCAAKVSHYGNYNNFKLINVTGTENMVKFCMKYNKKFYHVSTLSVSGNGLVDQSYIKQNFKEEALFNESNLYINQSLDNVYVRSKFEAEKLVLSNILNGLDGYIFRVGNLMNRFSDGKFQVNVDENAYISRLLSLSAVGAIPDYMLGGYMEFTPIDTCASAIIKIMQYGNKNNRIFHLFNHNHVDIIDFINAFRKYNSFEIISNEDFVSRIDKILKEKDSSKILSGIIRDFDENKKIVYDNKIKLKSDFTIKYLQKIGFSWPILDNNYFEKFLNYFYQLGYIEKSNKKIDLNLSKN